MFFPKPIPTAINDECTLPLIDYLPHSKGSMLITTRNKRLAKRLAGIRALIVVNPMAPQEAQKLLLEKRQATSPSHSDEDQSRRLVEALGFIPLAITQAAAFINENLNSLTEYLEMLRTSDSEMQQLLNEDLGDLRRDSQSHNSIVMTWKMSFDLISKQEPRAAEMLSRMAFLDRNGIPEILLRDRSDPSVDFKKALGTLLAFSLIKRKAVNRAEYELHSLVQLICQKWLKMQGTTAKWQMSAFIVVADVFPTGHYKTWTGCESLLPHALKVLEYGPNEAYLMPFSNLLSRVASFDMEQGRYEMARIRFLAASEMLKNSLGLENDLTLRCIADLACTYRAQGHFEEAEKLLVQVLEIGRRVLGVEHRDTLRFMNHLAVTYQRQHRWDLAEKLHTQVLEARKRVLGAEHPQTLGTMSSLASSYSMQQNWEEAEKLFLQVLEIKKRVLGSEHPNVLYTMNNLAIMYDSLRRREEAETLYVQVLNVTERVLGAEHPNALSIMYNLAFTYARQNRWDEAEKLFLYVIEVNKRVLGAEHPDTLVSMNILAVTYMKQRLWEKAGTLLAEMLEVTKRMLGAEHPATQTSMRNFAMRNFAIVCYRQERQDEAIAMAENIVEIWRRTRADFSETFDAAEFLEKLSQDFDVVYR